MAYVNLPGTFPDLLDGGLRAAAPAGGPRVLILGTATSGVSGALWLVRRPNSAVQEYGRTGTLVKGMYEALAQGASSVYLMRIGGTRASLTGIGCTAGGGGGYSVIPNLRDDAAGTRYSIYYDDSGVSPTGGILMVYDNTDEEFVYSNDPSNPIDFGVISVTGSRCLAGGLDIGTVSAPVAMSGVPVIDINVTYIAGTDGTDGSLMETYEALYDAYELLDFQQFDLVVPQNMTIDAPNHADLAAGTVKTAVEALVAYPDAGAVGDALTRLYVQEYQGQNYFWWDVDNDGTAEIYPTVGASSDTENADGETITAYQEVNFAYQLADFCYRATENYQACMGVIGVEAPNSLGFQDVGVWVGSAPTISTDPITGAGTILNASDNGTGLLGIKFLTGKASYRSGAEHGGLIATPSGWLNDTELTDDNNELVDIGKYLTVVGAWVVHNNPFDTTGRGYLGNFATGYAGFVSTLASNSAPTNKTVRRVRLPYRIKASKLDDLAGFRIVMLIQKPKGVVITDSPTAARPNTDYQRITTMRIVAETIQRLRDAGDPFLGEAISTSQINALNTSIEGVLSTLKSEGKLRDYRYQLSITAQQSVLGTATLDLILVPAFQLRRINVTTTLAAEIA